MLGEIDLNMEVRKSRLFLCRPDETTIAELSEAYGKEAQFSYNGIHELSFRLPTVVERNHKYIRNKNIDNIRGHYLIRYQMGTKTEYFIINNPNKEASDGLEAVSIKCFLRPYEIKNKIIRNYKATKKLYDVLGNDGILNDTLLVKTDWTVGYVDPEISDKYRTFDISEQTLLTLMNDLYETFNVIPVWNTINKKVSFYKEGNLGQDKGLRLEYGKYLRSVNKEEDFDNVTTRLYIYGKDGISINKYNPTGTDYIESLAYYIFPFERDIIGNVISQSYYLTDSLCLAILDYNELLNTKSGEFETLVDQLEMLQGEKDTLETELFTLETDLLIIEDQLEVAKATGESTATLEQDKDAKQLEIDSKNAEIATVDGQISTTNTDINTIKTEVSVGNNFTNAQITERNKFINEAVWSDQNYFNAKELYADGIERLEKLNQPIISYKVSLVDFLKVAKCQRDWDKLVLGDIVNIYYPSLKINIKAKIIDIVHNEEDNSIELEIANVRDIESGFLTLKDLFKKTVSSSTTVDMSKFKWDQSEENASDIDNLLNSIWDATKREILAGVNNSIKIGKKGIVAKDLDDPLKMVIIQGGRIALSGDGGNTWNTAIYPDKIAAELIVGKLGAFTEVRADQITLGDSGEKLSSTVVDDENYIKNNENYNQTFISKDGVQVKDNLSTNVVTLGEFLPNLYGLRADHSDGSYTQLTKGGLERFVAGESKPYQYETYIIEGTTKGLASSSWLDTNDAEYVSTQEIWLAGITISLPVRFKGKDFKSSLSFREANIPTANEGATTKMALKISSIDKVNATVNVVGYTYASSYGLRIYLGIDFNLITTL